MFNLFNFKAVQFIKPGAIVDNAAYAMISHEVAGFAQAIVQVNLGATDIAMTLLKLQHSDDNSTWSDAFVVGTDKNIEGAVTTLPSATDDDKIVVFLVDLRNVKRYIRVAATAGDGAAGTYLTACGLLFNPPYFDTNKMLSYNALQVCKV